MGGGSCGCGTYEGVREITLELSVNKETVLWMKGTSDVDNFHDDTEKINWVNGGSRIGACLPLEKKTLSEQQNVFYNCANERFPGRSYDLNIVVGGRDLR